MTVRQLRTLIAVAESGSFSAAADRIFLTHAGVGQQMKALEEELGVKLFDRSKRLPILTSQGRMIVDRARRVVRDYDALTRTEDDPGLAGELSLGAVRTTLTALVPRSLADMAQSCPELSIYVVPGLTSQLVEQVERGMIDLALVSRPRVLSPGLSWHVVAREKLMLLVPSGQRSTDVREILTRNPFIRFTRQAIVGGDIESWLHGQSIRVQDRVELENIEAICTMVELGLGVSIVPFNPAYMGKNDKLTYIQLDETIGCRELGLINREDSLKQTAIEAMRATADSICGLPKSG
ncbi:LysR substrate-binding domain-containing protein [Pseudooceanicola nitratireducens]|uniref:LysR substrate-binding domain-containing protein n=1 Tax=Pseudooceanicola nitratireducens TaxID=517719 RepID=UPI0023F283F4|nr:LysR substrate-binding domain-containing protein [Pseudooceanicola nitratireducens]